MKRNQLIRKCILWLALCATVLLGMYAETDSHTLRSAEDGVSVICAPANTGYDSVWTRETGGQEKELKRLEFRLRHSESRKARSIEVFFLFLVAFLPDFFKRACRIFCPGREKMVEREEYIIRYIHNLDGRKRVFV